MEEGVDAGEEEEVDVEGGTTPPVAPAAAARRPAREREAGPKMGDEGPRK